jgi:hypothetical protein
MNRNKLKTYAPQARREFIKAVTDRAAFYGLTKKKIEPVTEQGDVAVIGGKAFPKFVAANRKLLEQRIARQGFEQVVEAMAYTWFNRFVAIRYMELHGYLDHGYRVLSNPDGSTTPEIIEHAEHVDLPGLNKEEVIELKLDGNKEAELYDRLLLAQCHALYKAMPFLFEAIDDETELLLPDNLLHSDSLIRKLVAEIPEEDWQEVEIIGWLYQFYISEKKDEVIGKVVKSEDIPAATQLFTPNWIVKYLVQNSLGRQWMATYPDSPLKGQMEYYIEPAEQTPEVQEQLKAITPTELNPEELTLLDPACGSGHILVEAYHLLKAIYQERGYRSRDIPRLILEKNLYGLEIDDRAAQLAAFALMMKARADDRRIFDTEVQPNVLAIQESKGLNAKEITETLNQPIFKGEAPPPESLFEEIDDENTPLFSRKHLSEAGHILLSDVAELIKLSEHGKTFGSLIQVPKKLATRLPMISERVEAVMEYGGMLEEPAAKSLKPLAEQAQMLAAEYDAVITNPPYMGGKYYTSRLKDFVTTEYADAKADLYACFIQRTLACTKRSGFVGLITIPNWMFLSSFEAVRRALFKHTTIDTFSHNGRGVFGSDFGSCAFTIRNDHLPNYRGSYRRLFSKQGSVASNEELENRYHTADTHTPSSSDFAKVSGVPVAYWVKGLDNFTKGTLTSKAESGGRFKTHNDEKYVRFWWEVSVTARYWKRYLKGGEFRRFFGNEYHVADWRSSALEDYQSHGGLANPQYHAREGITCSKITAALSSFRVKRAICEYSSTSPTIFPSDGGHLALFLAYLNSKVSDYYLAAINPSITTNVTDILAQPDPSNVLSSENQAVVSAHADELVRIAQADWDSFESSWDFQTLPIVQQQCSTVEQSQRATDIDCSGRIARMKQLEEDNNRIFIESYEIHGDLSPEVSDDHIALHFPDREEDIRRLISYALGCMMGRYSLDEPGLIYAHSGNQGFDASKYRKFPADQDGIIPITDTDWFPDDAANRFVQFIATAWPKEHLEENLKFVAESLGPKKGESSRDTIRRYLSQDFFKHHLSMYKKRPIYWLYSSGKQRAFECLVYLHRYNEGTLSRMRTEYVIPLQGKIDARIEQLKEDITSATSTAHGKRLQKERDKLIKQQGELRKFDEHLRHYADLRICLDLDDGVKVNYGKFGDLLAEVKAVTGTTEEADAS